MPQRVNELCQEQAFPSPLLLPPPPPMLIENMTNLVGRENTFVLGYLIEITQSSVAQDLSGKWEVRVMKVRFLSSEIVAATLEVSLD